MARERVRAPKRSSQATAMLVHAASLSRLARPSEDRSLQHRGEDQAINLLAHLDLVALELELAVDAHGLVAAVAASQMAHSACSATAAR